ncbi:S1 RNA-binding domain-containing protein [Micromonospora fulviviridis]|uniref:S1 RNA-binding domain-containing protein n=1 Tax=Micromonospora fulviviridis TaxID=47860 RepID=UPI00378CEB3D
MPATWTETLTGELEWEPSPATTLGILVSGPPLAPYPLVRQVRRALLGPGTLHLEAELSESDIVEAVSKDGVELTAEFRTAARAALRRHVLSGAVPAAELRAATRCDDLGMSPLLLLEEQLVWAYLSQDDPRQECDRLLTDCLLTIAREDRRRILDWAAGALFRLPDLVLDTPSAWLLSEVCLALHRETRRLPPPPMENLPSGPLQEVLRLVPSALVGFHRDGTTLQLGPIGRQRRIAFPLPAIALRPVTVTWPEPDDATGPGPAGAPRRNHELTVDTADGIVEIPVGSGPVRLRNAAGATVDLAAFDPGGPPPELADVDRMLDLLEEAWRESRPLRAQIVRAMSARAVIVRFHDAWAISAYLRFERGWVEEQGLRTYRLVGEDVEVRISNFDRRLQRIMCRPATTTTGILTPGMDLVGRFINAADFGLFVSVPKTSLGFAGPTATGLVHESGFPPGWRRDGPPGFEKGDPVEVRVVTVDPDTGRISLSLRMDRFLSQYPEGTVVEGRVVRVLSFGALVAIPSGVDGLLHISEIAADRDVAFGDAVLVRVLKVDHDSQRVWFATEPPVPEGAPTRTVMLVPGTAARIASAAPADAERLEAVAEFIRRTLGGLPGPMRLVDLAKAINDEFGAAVTGEWLGFGKFIHMLVGLVPEVEVDAKGPGHVRLR